MCNSIGNIFRIVIIGGCCLALAMQFFVTFNCSFLVTPDRGVGIWYVEDGDGKCVEWPADLDDSIVKGAQSALTISTIAGFMAGILVLFEWVCCEVCCAGCLEGLAFCTSWVIGSSVFMIYGIPECGNLEAAVEAGDQELSDQGCEWGTDASYMTVACAAYLICGIILCCAPQPDPICR